MWLRTKLTGMKIVEYDEIDPLSALNLSLLALDFAFTPEHAVHIRRTDPRPFPCFALYAVDGNAVLGQVGVFRLPMVSRAGREDVGGVWAVSTHPQYSGRGIASLLLDEAHHRMRQAGLRFSTLGTSRSRISHRLYQHHGYEDMNIWATGIGRWETVYQPTRLTSQPLGQAGFDLIESLYTEISQDYLGFAWRHMPFGPLRDKIEKDDVWILLENNQPIGYALTRQFRSVLTISNLVLKFGVDAAEAIAAVMASIKTLYVQVTVSRPAEIASLKRAGFEIAYPSWEAFMLKPLVPEVDIAQAGDLFGIGTDQFLISWLDTT